MHRSTLIGSAVARSAPATPFSLGPPTRAAHPQHEPWFYLLCAVELCERLASVMVFSLLVLYLNEGLGLGTGLSAKVASYVHMLSYAAGVLGGLLADRGLGAGRAALGGLILLALGYNALGSVHSVLGDLWVPAALVVAGHGLFKPNCTALVGALYSQSDPRRANAFVYFYYALNVGAMLGPCLGGLVRTSLGWGIAFRVAAVFVAVSSLLFSIGNRYFVSGAPVSAREPQTARPLPATEAYKGSSGSRMGALVLVLGVLAVFGASLSQSYGTLLLWARDDARRVVFGYVVPPDFFAALPAVFVLLFGPLVGRLSRALEAQGFAPTELGKFTAGMLLCALAYGFMLMASLVNHGTAPASPLWLIACKVALSLGEILGVPVGLALAETLALPRSKGLTLGLSYGAHALGYWLGGAISALWPVWSHAEFFGALALGCLVAALIIAWQGRRFTRALALK